jgi:rubredoxin
MEEISFIDTRPTIPLRRKENQMQKYVCNICGYVYDPSEGDPDHGVPKGTPFEKLPADWTCPVCGASKSDFSLQA